MISGIYAKIQYNWRDRIYFILIGKTENKERREKEYGIGDSFFKFDYFMEMNNQQLIKGENKIKEYLVSNGLTTYGNSYEQFEIGTEHNLEFAEKILENYFNKKLKYRNYKKVDYEVSALPGYGNVLGKDVTDIRPLREKCSVIKDKPAQIITKAGVGESIRKVKTAAIIENGRLIKLDEVESVPLCIEGWYIWQMAKFTYRDFPNITKKTIYDCVNK